MIYTCYLRLYTANKGILSLNNTLFRANMQ